MVTNINGGAFLQWLGVGGAKSRQAPAVTPLPATERGDAVILSEEMVAWQESSEVNRQAAKAVLSDEDSVDSGTQRALDELARQFAQASQVQGNRMTGNLLSLLAN